MCHQHFWKIASHLIERSKLLKFRLFITIVFSNYNWYVSIWSITFVSPLTTRISVISSFPARRPRCSNSRKVSSGVTFAFALYWSDWGQVFCCKCLSSFKMEVSVFCFLNWIALMVSSCFLFLGCRVDRLFLGRFSFWRLSFWRRRPSLLRCLANAALCLGSSCDAGGLSSGSDSRFGSVYVNSIASSRFGR